MKTRLRDFCDRLIEAGWLLALALVPAFFNVRTARVFEPDKGAMLRGLALMMAAAWLFKAIERAVYWLGGRLGWVELPKATRPRRATSPRAILIVLCILFVAVTLASSLTSVHPRISLMGSYQRGQGADLTLCLAVIFLLVATHLRTRDQFGRLLAAVALGSLPVTVYAMLQRVGVDPLPWGPPEPVIVSTLGNVNFLAAYLVMAIPLTLAWVILLARAAWNALESRVREMTGYGLSLLAGLVILGLQVYVLAIADAQIAVLALLAAAVPSALLLVAVRLHNSQGRRVVLGLAGVLLLGILVVLTVISFADVSLTETPLSWSAEPTESPDMLVRLMIWEGARDLLYQRPSVGSQPDRWASLRPLLGYGLETMYYTYNAVYQSELGHYEVRTASPDRAFNQLLDVAVNLGWAGVGVFVFLLAAFFGFALKVVARARGTGDAIVASGMLWAGLAHFVDSQFNIPIMTTRLLFWIGLGVVAALVARLENEDEADGLANPLSASGVALLLLPTITLVTVAAAGFLLTPRDAVWPGVVMTLVCLLAVIASVGARHSRKGNSQANDSRPCQSLVPSEQPVGMPRPYWNGLLIVLALGLLAGAVVLVNHLVSLAMSPATITPSVLHNVDKLLDYTQQTAKFPLYASWVAAFVGWLSVGLSLPGDRIPSPKWGKGRCVAFVVAFPLYVLVTVVTVLLILGTCIRPMQADASFKAVDPYNRDGTWETAVVLYEAAIDLAPREDFYYIFLGRAQLQQAQSEYDAASRESGLAQVLETLERAHTLNPLNPDHVANLARFHRQAAELETDPVAQATHSHVADKYYAQAMALAPQKVVLLNEWAMLQWQSSGEEQACRMLERSLALDPGFEQTQQLYTDFCSQALPGQPQNLDFED